MIKRSSKSIPITLMMAAVALLSLLLLSIQVGHAWFTISHYNGIKIMVQLNEMKLELYQTINDQKILINKTKENLNSDEPSYITLEKDWIVADEFNKLELSLVTDDDGAGTYLRYKLEIFAVSVEFNNETSKYEKVETPIDVIVECSESFVKDGNYYCYGTADAEGNLTDSTMFEKTGEEAVEVSLLTGFIVPYSSYMELEGSESVKIILTIEGSDTKY